MSPDPSDGRAELRAVTGPDYGRIYDHELVEAVQRIYGNAALRIYAEPQACAFIRIATIGPTSMRQRRAGRR